MRNKHKLKGDIFIENDLSWEKRKIQERINKWVKEQKGGRKDIKVGLSKVREYGRYGM